MTRIKAGFLAGGGTRKSLMQRMMATLGIAGRLGGLPAHRAVEARAAARCADCGHETECAGWLAAHENDEQAEPPDFCANRDLVARLRRLPPAP